MRTCSRDIMSATPFYVAIFLITTFEIGDASVLNKLMINTLTEYNKYCNSTGKICVMKCCADDLYIGDAKNCIANNDSTAILDFHEVVIYDKDMRETHQHVRGTFFLVPSTLLSFDLVAAYDLYPFFNNYLLEDGSVMLEQPNTYDRWTHLDGSQICMDYAFPNGETVFKTEPRFWVITPDDEPFYETDAKFVSAALLLSCVFLTLVLVVYGLLPELRNLCGKILMAYVISLLGAFLMLATLLILTVIDEHTDDACATFTFLIYFFFLSSFCWMNVMSFDIWWTFRGYAKARPIHRRGESFKFGMYCTYAWGLPLAMTVALGLLNYADLRHIPWFITPKIVESGCFFQGGSKFVYLYVPMLTLIVINWMLFLMTSFNIWRLSRGTAVLDSPAAGNPSAHRTHRHRFMLYLKLSVIMGVSWVLEAVSALLPQFRVWYLSDCYNLLIGVFIFLIFVCKQKIFRKLGKRLRCKRPQWSPNSNSRSNSCSSDSDASQDTTTAICSNPTGVTYYKR